MALAGFLTEEGKMDTTSLIIGLLFIVATALSIIVARACGLNMLASTIIGIPVGFVLVFIGLWFSGKTRRRLKRGIDKRSKEQRE